MEKETIIQTALEVEQGEIEGFMRDYEDELRKLYNESVEDSDRGCYSFEEFCKDQWKESKE